MEMMFTMCFSVQSRVEADWTVNLRIYLILTFYDIFWSRKLRKLLSDLYCFPFESWIFLMIMLMMLSLLCWTGISMFFKLIPHEKSLNGINKIFATKCDSMSTTNEQDENDNGSQYRWEYNTNNYRSFCLWTAMMIICLYTFLVIFVSKSLELLIATTWAALLLG